jgi:hypothetical protein
MQFKQQFGVIDGTNTISLPGTPTVDANGAQTTGTLFAATGVNLTPAQQIEGWLLGDSGVTEQPVPKNFMRDVTAFLGPNAVENWLAPFFNLSNAGQPLSSVTIDDNNTYNSFNNANLTFATTFGTYVDGSLAGVPQSPLFNPNNGTPPTGAPVNGNGWETAIGDPVFEQNYYLIDYRRTQNTSAATSNGLMQRADPTKNLPYNGATTLATWAFAVPNPAPPSNVLVNQPTAPPATNPPNNVIRNIPVAQAYDAYAWFPTQNASPLSLTPELHITDAEYTIQIVNPYTNAILFSTTALVDQTSGGAWVKVGGPFTVPIIVNPNTNTSQSAIITITLDNTTNEFVGATSVTQLPNYHVVANAVQIRPDDGTVYGSPVSINISDYPELASGYYDAGVDGAGVNTGGFPISYRAASEGAVGNINSATAVATSGGNYITPNTPLAGEYTEDKWGDFWPYNAAPEPAPKADPTPAPGADVTVINSRPIDQVVYTTRSINIGGFLNSADQTIGAVYAIDGLTGNVIWRFPSVLPFTVDDSQTAPDPFVPAITPFTTSNPEASDNQGDVWQQGSPTTPAPNNFPGTDFFGSGYTRISAESASNPNPTNNPPPTATWTPTQLTAAPQNYFVYVWFPSQTATEQHITDAQYTVAGVACNQVNQQTGGHWVQLTNNQGTPDNPVFNLAAGATITLINTTGNHAPGAQPAANVFVVADAVLIVPVNAPASISSTPVVVRNMKVMVDATTQTFSTRTVLLFTDNSPGGGRVYCLDAAGNADGDDTVIDQAQEPVNYDANGNLIPPPTGPPSGVVTPANFTYLGPLQPLHLGTTKAYWIWQPDPTKPILQTNNTNDKGGPTATETPETVPDPNRDMPIPGAFELNSPTVSLAADAGDPQINAASLGLIYQGASVAIIPNTATIFVGNNNGTLYSLNSSGQLNDPNDQQQRYQTLDVTEPTVEVNWWFNTGGAIAYAPAINPKADGNTGDATVYVTSYDPDANNQGRLFAIDAANNKGPLGNQGKGDPKSAGPQVPGSLNYNINQIPFWSFPDGYGTVNDANGAKLSTTLHLDDSNVPGFSGTDGPALPLGDMAGAPTVYTKDDGTTRIYITANEPTPFGDGPSGNGRIYAVLADGGAKVEGTMAWAYPDINGNPDSVGNVNQQDATFDFTVAGTLPNQPLGAFTQFDAASGLVVSSSPVAGHVTFPANLFPPGVIPNPPPNLGGLQDGQQQMLYTGCTDGVLYALNLGTQDDPNPTLGSEQDATRLIYNDPIGDGPLVSTPTLLSGSATNTTSGLNNVGGVIFLTSEVGNIWEIEATPFADPSGTDTTTPLVNRDWGWAGPGGISSPAVGAFDSEGFTLVPSASSPVNPNPTRDDSEWLYCGSDTGFLYGFTPNSSTNGGFVPGNYIPVQNVGPNNNIDLTRNFMSQVFSTNPGGTADWNVGSAPPANPSFEWGQTVYIAIYGVDNPLVNTGTTQFPLGITVSFTLTEHDRSGRSVAFQKQIDLRDTNKIAKAANFPPANLAAAIANGSLKLGINSDGNYYVAVFPYTIDPGHSDTSNGGDPFTPGPDIQISNIQEVAYANGQQVTVHGYSSTPTIVNQGASGSKTNNFQLVPGIDQATFGILNPLGIAGGGTTLGGLQTTIALSPAGVAVPAQALGPFTPVDTTNPATFPSPTGWQLADSNGNEVPLSPPVGGSVTSNTGTIINPTQSLSSQGATVTTEPITIAADTGEISHGSTGDTGTGSQANPVGTNAPIANPNLAGFSFGSSFLNVADRSALGTIGENISTLRMESPQIGWVDNSNGNAPNAVINMMPWDIAPTPVADSPTNPSPDYPNIPNGNIHVQMLPRNENLGGSEVNGTQGDITSAQEQLANSNGTPLLNRTIRPNPVLVQVSVPKFQPANLETLDPSGLREGGEHSHVQNTTANGAAGWVPEGYLSSVKVFVDGTSGGIGNGGGSASGKWDPTKAYRVVTMWSGVPADMSTAIAQQTTDVGSVPAGFGLWNPTNVGAAPPPITPGAWSPYALSPGGSNLPLYKPWFIPVPVYNTGNVNLLNVHFDQNIASYNPVGGAITAAPPLDMLSDGVTDQGATGQPLWPFVDNTGVGPGMYTGTSGLPIVRSGLDQDIYMTSTLNPAEAVSPVPGPSAHKARPGTPGPGAPIKLPDDPIDQNNPDFVNQGAYPSVFYNNDPAVSIAVPLGTPVGDYSQTLRTFEGSDVPYNPWQGPAYGGVFYSPGLWNSAANSQYSFVFSNATNSPMQFFSDPGTVLKANVIEDRVTDDSAITANLVLPQNPPAVPPVDYEPGALSMLDPTRLLGPGANGTAPLTPAHSNDIQPWAFRDVTSGAAGGFGLLWPSQRDEMKNGQTGYDIFSASLANPVATGPLTMPMNPAAAGNSGSWWAGLINKTAPDDLTQNSGGAAASPLTSYNPYVVTPNVLPTGVSADQNTALRVDSLVGGAPQYTLMYTAPFTGTEPAAGSWLPLHPSSSAPIFAPRGVYVDNATALIGQPLILFWSATSGGRSQIYYQSPHATTGTNTSNVDGYPLILPQAPATAPAPSAATLQLPAGVTNVSNPTPVARPFTYSWPDGKGNIQQWPVIDVTYSGVSTLTGQTDVYTTRYIIWQSDPTTHNDPVNDPIELLPVPFYVKFATTGTTALMESPETQTLTANATATTWEAQDVGWVRDLNTFALSYIPAGQVAATAIIGGAAPVTTQPIYDRSSGQWVFNNVTLPWTGAAGTVYVNPDQGTVSFSTPPPSAKTAGGTTVLPVVIASFVPQALRATIHSGTNTAPVAFIDEAFKPNTLQIPGQPAATSPVQASRYWYVWRKASGSAGGAASTASTLYFKTKRLTVVLQWPIGYPGNPANGTVTITPPTVTINIPGVNPALPIKNLVDISPGHYTASPAPGQTPPMVPGRIFFPDYVNVGGVNYSTEGLVATISYQPAPYEDTSGTPVTPQPVNNFQQSTQWLDEPYANSPTDTAFRAGERVVPINTSINEGEPSAFLDPAAYGNTVANLAPIPHRVWLFWVSTRSAPDLGNGAQLGTGSDVYSEALDPRFSETSTP